MSTLSLKNKVTSYSKVTDEGLVSIDLNKTVPLEDWYEEMADEELDPLNQLIAEEEAEETEVNTIIVNKQETIAMSTLQLNNKPAFDLNAWMNTLAVATDAVIPATTKVINKPDWLEIKGPLTAANAFAITAGIVKAARKITDGLFIAKNRHSDAIEALAIQEARCLRETGEKGRFGAQVSKSGLTLGELGSGRQDAPGFNPDGQEYAEVLGWEREMIGNLEAIIENGSNMLNTLLDWIDEVSVELHLEVETGHTVSKDLIGNEFRRARYERLTRDTLMYGIAAQKEFIRNARGL